MIDEGYLDELVLKSQKDDKEAFSRIYDLLIDRVHRYVYFKAPPDQVDDLVAISFVKIWKNIRQYKKTSASFQAWVFRIVRNAVIDHHRFHRSLVSYSLDETITDERREANPYLLAEQRINAEILRKALSQLKESYQQVIIMKFLNDMTNEEVAYILKKRNSAVRVLQFRALEALKLILKGKGLKF